MQKSIFVIEDDTDIRETVESVLQEEGFRVYSASSGVEAMQMLHQVKDSCLVLLDVMMAEMNGFEFLKNAQEQSPDFSRIPVIAMTASKGETLPRGVIGLIKKPFELDHLLKVIHGHCSV